MKYLLIILVVLLISISSAIKITEVELNPKGMDKGNEWIEFYCKKKTDLSSYMIVNNDGDKLSLSGECRGYFVHTFEKQWLDNSDEKVFLYKGNKLIDKTDLLKDDKNDDKTWSLCEDWKFRKPTEDSENDCNSDEEKENKEETEIKNIEENKQPQNIKLESINLEPKNTEDEKDETKSNRVVYWFIGFFILIILLFVAKRVKKRKRIISS